MRERKVEGKRTLLVGATTNPTRYAFIAAKMFSEDNIEFIPIGIKKGEVFGRDILDLRSKPQLEDIHTITLYIGPAHQEEWIDYLLSLNPQRIIFNPGSENFDFFQKADDRGIEVHPACTLVMLRTGQF